MWLFGPDNPYLKAFEGGGGGFQGMILPKSHYIPAYPGWKAIFEKNVSV